MKTIVLANAKGSTGKTTCAVNLSACLALHHGKRVLGIGQNLDRDVKREVSEFFGGLMIQSVIHKNIKLGEAASDGKAIIEFDSSAPGAFDFLKLTKELLDEYEPEEEKRSAKRSG